jgi:membrane protease YdiL (CAAX protease family)
VSNPRSWLLSRDAAIALPPDCRRVAGQDPTPALLIELVLFILVPGTVSWLIGGWTEVRRLFAGVLRFRFPVALWAVVLFACPILTLGVAAATGTLRTPPNGWPAVVTAYLVSTLLVGGLIANIWEETAWGRMVQGRLMAKHGLLIGSLLTAIPFGLIHLPLAFSENGLFGTAWNDVLITWGVLLGLAPFVAISSAWCSSKLAAQRSRPACCTRRGTRRGRSPRSMATGTTSLRC